MSAHTAISHLEARHLQKSYGSRQVVFDVSVKVEKGEVVGLLGPNGAGKTTSFYMIVGLVRTDGGQILMDGEDVTRMPIHRRARMGLSYLPQEASIFRKLTVAENVRAVLELQLNEDGKPLNNAEISARLQALLKDLRVDHLHDSPSLALSGGERRRVEIARALATGPRFILLDEPFAALGPAMRAEMLALVAEVLKGRTVLMVTHDPTDLRRIGGDLIVVADGSVSTPAPAQEMLDNPPPALRDYLGQGQ